MRYCWIALISLVALTANAQQSTLGLSSTTPLTITGVYCDPVVTNNAYVVAGAIGNHTNSAGTSVDFSQANGTYAWSGGTVGRSFDGAVPTGVFISTNHPNWFMSYQYWGMGASSWIIYNTNTWLPSAFPTATNAVIAGGLLLSPLSDFATYLPDMKTTNFWQYMPGVIPAAVTVVPLYSTNTITVSRLKYDPVNALLTFPKVGPTQTSVRRGNTFPPNQSFPVDPGILWLTNGASVVRGIEVMVGQWSPITYRSNFWLQIFPNYGTNPTAFAQVNSNYMAFNVPLASLVPCKWNATNIANNMPTNGWSTAYIDVATDGATPFMKDAIKLPFLCTNGCFIRVIDTALNAEWTASKGFSTVNYEIDTTGQVSNSPLASWRLHGVLSRTDSASAILGTPNPSAATDWTKLQQIMFTATNCSGVVLGIWAGLAGADSSGFELANWEWISDGQYPPGQMEGEDPFLTPFEFTAAGVRMNNTHGVVTRAAASPPGTFDAYREFTSDFQFSWQNSMKAFLTPGGGLWGDIVTLYYSNP
jgi:hypothetical protein